MTERCHGTFTKVSLSHGTFPECSDDHGIITDSRNFHGHRNYGKSRKFGNVSSIVNNTRINPCIVRINHGNVTELSRKIYGTSWGS